MSKIFLDIGAHGGEIALKHYREHHWDRYILVEPHPRFRPYLKEVKSKIEDCTVVEAAMSNINGKVEFYPSLKGLQGSTICVGKTSAKVDYDNPIMVKSIDFCGWFSKMVVRLPSVIWGMNMDIEGAEYKILPGLMQGGGIEKFEELTIEFHSGRFKNCDEIQETHKELKRKLGNYNNGKWIFWKL